jgi:hypothetical protein
VACSGSLRDERRPFCTPCSTAHLNDWSRYVGIANVFPGLALLRVDDRLPCPNLVLGRASCRLRGDLGGSVQFAYQPGVEALRYGTNLPWILTSQLVLGETRTEPINGILVLQVSFPQDGDSELAFHVHERTTSSTILLSLYMEAPRILNPPQQSPPRRQAGRTRRVRVTNDQDKQTNSHGYFRNSATHIL